MGSTSALTIVPVPRIGLWAVLVLLPHESVYRIIGARLSIDMLVDMRIDTCMDMCTGMCTGMYIDMCVDMRTDMCIDM